MAWYRCGANASSGGNEIAFVPEGKYIANSGKNDFRYDTNLTTVHARSGLVIFSGDTVAGHSAYITTTASNTVYVTFYYYKGTVDNMTFGDTVQIVTSSQPLTVAIPDDVEIATLQCWSTSGSDNIKVQILST